MLKKTPFYELHLNNGGDMVEFAGYHLPIRFKDYGVIAEHNAVRNAAGLFDVSHMGELEISGANTINALNLLLSNEVSDMYDGQVRYSVLPNSVGGAIDDVLVYRFSSEKYWLVVNAANKRKVVDTISLFFTNSIGFKDLSDDTAQLALQGPNSKEIMLKLVPEEKLPAKYYSFKSDVMIDKAKCIVSRTGYTGEFGYEIYCDNKDAINLYNSIMAAGKQLGLINCGLGARDTLRLEAGMPLYGHEMSEDIPIKEVGVDFAIKLDKPEFVGKVMIERYIPKYVRLGARVLKGIARYGDEVFCEDKSVGIVTSGTHSPSLGVPIAMLRVKKKYANKPLYALVRGKKLQLEIVPLPFYKK